MADTVPGIRIGCLYLCIQHVKTGVNQTQSFELMFGRKPVLPVELDVADESPETLLSDFNTRPECSQPVMDKMIEARYET